MVTVVGHHAIFLTKPLKPPMGIHVHYIWLFGEFLDFYMGLLLQHIGLDHHMWSFTLSHLCDMTRARLFLNLLTVSLNVHIQTYNFIYNSMPRIMLHQLFVLLFVPIYPSRRFGVADLLLNAVYTYLYVYDFNCSFVLQVFSNGWKSLVYIYE